MHPACRRLPPCPTPGISRAPGAVEQRARLLDRDLPEREDFRVGALGAFLARAGHDITLVDTAIDHVDAINAHGLRIAGPIANFPVPLTAQPPNRQAGSWNTITLAQKAHHRRAAARALLPHLS